MTGEVMTRSSAHAVFIAVFASIAAWILLITLGQRSQYLITEWSRNVRAFVVFPTLALALCLLIFAVRWKATGMTGFQQRMRQLNSRKERRMESLGLFAGLLLLPAGLAWTS